MALFLDDLNKCLFARPGDATIASVIRNVVTVPHLQTFVDSGEGSMSLPRRWCRMNRLTDYVKTAEAAEILGVSQNTLRKWAADGAIPMHRNPANRYRLF